VRVGCRREDVSHDQEADDESSSEFSSEDEKDGEVEEGVGAREEGAVVAVLGVLAVVLALRPASS
jgi:hypothetical protein